MMDMAVWRDYLQLLDQLGETMERLTVIEREKTAAVSQGALDKVEACMKQEQVISLSLRGMEQKRGKMLEQLGLKGVPLRELEERGPRESHLETKAVVERLRRRYEVFQSASEVARNTLECNLRTIENIQKAAEDQAAQGGPPPEGQPRQADFRA